MNVRAANNYVLVNRHKEPDFTKGGLYVPENAKRIPKRGTILHIGPKCKYDMKIGDEIAWVQQGVEKFFDEQRNPHIFVEEKYILAVIQKDAEQLTHSNN